MNMAHEVNELGQPIGLAVANWQPPQRPTRDPMVGQFCRLESLDSSRHAADLHAANALDVEGRNWTYLPYGPFAKLDQYVHWVSSASLGDDPLFFAILDHSTGRAIGVASFLRIDPKNGSIEVGHINYSPLCQRKPAATEAMYLMMKRAFDLGYRRYEWKCDALNAKSRRAATRLGLTFEGIFRQATVYKNRNRDTAWYSAIDTDWATLEGAFQQWLDTSNFDDQGHQRTGLSQLTATFLKPNG
jgi:RimJ/RimL family protein N-acetyltransferase